MQMSSRIRRSWQTLVEQLSGIGLGERAFIHVLRNWLRQSPAAVSKKAAVAYGRAKGIELILREEPAELPISTAAADGFAAALREADLPKDPTAYINFVDRLCRSLAVFHREDDCCPVCQGELELWTEGNTCFEICDLLGCCFDSQGMQLTNQPIGLRPANRHEVLKRYPHAPLVRLEEK